MVNLDSARVIRNFHSAQLALRGANIRLSSDMHHAKATLTRIYANAAHKVAGEQAPVLAWPLVCGSKIAQRTLALGCANGELAVRVPDKIWRKELQCFSDRYLAALNQMSRHKVKSIRFVAAD